METGLEHERKTRNETKVLSYATGGFYIGVFSMKRMAALLFTLALAAFVSLCFAIARQARAADTNSALSSRVDKAVRVEVANGFSGSVLVVRGNASLLDKGYGAVRGVSISPKSRFWIASVGKQFTSAAILRCRDAGWLTLDDPISRFFPTAPVDKRAITIRQLLAHLSGLDQTYASEGTTNRADAVNRMLSHPLIDTPGHKFHYSNDNYELAAAIVEVASGDDYKDFVIKNFFRHAGLRDTGFAASPGAQSVVPARNPTPARLSTPGWGEAGVYSTTRDLLKWYRALSSGSVLSRGSVNDLFAPVASIGEGQTALGWFIGKSGDGPTYIFTRGNEDWGPNSLLYAYPESGVVVVVLTHGGDSNGDLSWSRFIHAKIQELLFP
jgi:CubicO group peptidase (beta-lactamase class C family)